jgi:hypothetical protein
MFPGLTFPCTQDVQGTLKKDMEGKVRYRLDPPRGSSGENTTAALKLLENLGNPTYSEPGVITHMQSFTLDQAKAEATGWEALGCLGHSTLEVTVAPAKEVFELECYQNYLSTTLLSGSKVWLVFPPKQENLDRLHKVYQDMHASFPLTVPHVLVQMQHGIAIIQNPGQTFLLPPYWPAMAFCTRMSTSCGFFTATATNFMQRVECMDLRLSITALCDTPEQQQAHFVQHATELATHLTNIFAEKLPKGVKIAGIQQAIYGEWNKSIAIPGYTNMHQKVARLLSMINDQVVAHSIRQKLQQVWTDFAVRKRQTAKKKLCFWCRMSIESMPGKGKTLDQRLAQHIVDVHCSL